MLECATYYEQTQQAYAEDLRPIFAGVSDDKRTEVWINLQTGAFAVFEVTDQRTCLQHEGTRAALVDVSGLVEGEQEDTR